VKRGPGTPDDGRALKVKSVGTEALRRLGHGDVPVTVHSSYSGAVNLQTPGGLVALVPSGAGRGPISLTMDVESFRTLPHLPWGEAVAASRERLSLSGGVTVELSGSVPYPPLLTFERAPAPPRRLARNIGHARKVASARGKLGGMGGLLFVLSGRKPRSPVTLSPYSAAALPATRSLLDSLEAGDRPGVRMSADQLSGLGPGLTPSADDMMSGMLAALVLGARNGLRCARMAEVATEIPRSAEGRTTLLSVESLRLAARGMAGERVSKMVEEIYTGSERGAESSTADVLRIGETSGTDLAVGILLGAELALKGWRRPG
jgi:Protein of unknown function (DUF2877)